MITEIKAPNPIPKDLHYMPTIFTAGSIDMGAAKDWQQEFKEGMEGGLDAVILNPRRNDWDSSWVQSISNPQFREQVEWELDHLTSSEIVIFYFDPDSKSPITLLELGLVAKSNTRSVVVCCPPGYWRRGNVEVVCSKYHLMLVSSMEELISITKDFLADEYS